MFIPDEADNLNFGAALSLTSTTLIISSPDVDFIYINRHSCMTGCELIPCENNGVCYDGSTCMCPEGYEGEFCETTNACFSNPCQNGATCSSQQDDSFNGWDLTCHCLEGWEGDFCETVIIEDDVSLCESAGDICQNGGTCVADFIGVISCLCVHGYEGAYCETIIESVFEEDDFFNPENDAYSNSADSSYSGTEDSVGSDVSGNDGSSDDSSSSSSSDSYDICDSDPCLNGGTCKVWGNGFVCSCEQAYEGPICETEFDACASGPCQNGGLCTEADGYFTCDCDAVNYHGDYCDIETTPCSSSPCGSNGICVDIDSTVDVNGTHHNSTFDCLCDEFFSGDFCENAQCWSSPCQNGGSCVATDDTGGFYCDCTDTKYGGFYCEHAACASSPCENGGLCTGNSFGFDCACAEPYTGDYCNIPRCDSNPCANGGVCSNIGNQTMCDCTGTNYTSNPLCSDTLNIGEGVFDPNHAVLEHEVDRSVSNIMTIVGLGLIAAALIGVVWFMLSRRRKQKSLVAPGTPDSAEFQVPA
jgi:Notch-like protein